MRSDVRRPHRPRSSDDVFRQRTSVSQARRCDCLTANGERDTKRPIVVCAGIGWVKSRLNGSCARALWDGRASERNGVGCGVPTVSAGAYGDPPPHSLISVLNQLWMLYQRSYSCSRMHIAAGLSKKSVFIHHRMPFIDPNLVAAALVRRELVMAYVVVVAGQGLDNPALRKPFRRSSARSSLPPWAPGELDRHDRLLVDVDLADQATVRKLKAVLATNPLMISRVMVCDRAEAARRPRRSHFRCHANPHSPDRTGHLGRRVPAMGE